MVFYLSWFLLLSNRFTILSSLSDPFPLLTVTPGVARSGS